MPKRRRHRHQNRTRAPRPLAPEPSTAGVIQVPCEAHDAAQGLPCYRHAAGVCAGRIRAWLAHAATGTAARPAERPAPTPAAQPTEEPQRPPQIIPEDVRSSVPVDMDRLSPLERRAAEIRAAQREQDQAEAIRRERRARARRHWTYLQQTTPTPTEQKGI